MGGLGRQSYAAFAGSIGILSIGMSYGWVSPVLIELTDEDGEIQATKEQYSWIAADIEIGFLATPFLASYTMDKFGRKRPMLCAAPLLLVSWILTITTRSVEILYAKRILDGMIGGMVVTIAPVYLAEIAEATVRGSILLSITVTWYAGTLLQFCVGTYLPYNVSAGLNMVAPIVYCVLFSFLPESPYYLMMKKKEKKAAKSLMWFRNAQLHQVAAELTEIADYLEKDAQNQESWTNLLFNPTYRKCSVVMIVVGLATIMTGVTTIFAYATEIFSETSHGILNPDTCSVAIASLFFIISIPICLLVDKIGRRPLVIVSSGGCCLSSFASACYFYFKDQIEYTWIPFLTIGSYCFFVSIGLVPIMVAFQGELFPSSVKSIASGMTQVLLTFASLSAIKLFYIIGSTLGLYVNYAIYAMVGLVATVWLYFNVPETKNKTFSQLLEELQGNKITEKPVHIEELKVLRGVD